MGKRRSVVNSHPCLSGEPISRNSVTLGVGKPTKCVTARGAKLNFKERWIWIACHLFKGYKITLIRKPPCEAFNLAGRLLPTRWQLAEHHGMCSQYTTCASGNAHAYIGIAQIYTNIYRFLKELTWIKKSVLTCRCVARGSAKTKRHVDYRALLRLLLLGGKNVNMILRWTLPPPRGRLYAACASLLRQSPLTVQPLSCDLRTRLKW